jgi:DNA-directed RNA polymerase beta' subunit
MKLSIIPKSEYAGCGLVKTSTIQKGKGKFEQNGLYSEQVFGPLKNYRCQCKDAIVEEESVCPKCGVKATTSSMRRITYATIPVDRIIHPVIMEILLSFNKTKSIIEKILSGKAGIIKTETQFEVTEIKLADMEEIPDDIIVGLDAIYELALYLVDKSSNSNLIDTMKNLMDEGSFFINYVVVIPPAYRPLMVSKDGKLIMDNINKYYLSILEVEKPKFPNKNMITLYEIQLQSAVLELYKYIFEIIGKKEGLLRNHMAGRRIDFSGRAVITPDSSLSINQVRVPRLILLELWQLELIKYLLDKEMFISFRYAYDYLHEMYNNHYIDPEIVEAIDSITKGGVVLLNRQPTLHRGSLMAFEVVPGDGFSIGINPLVCDPFNADFDGDQMAIYRPLSKIASNESKVKLMPSNNLFQTSDGELQFGPKQDIVYGLYRLALEDKTKIESVLGHTISSTLTKKQLMKYLTNDSVKDWTILDKIKNLGFAYTMQHPTTMSISDFKDIPIDNMSGNWKDDFQKLNDHVEKLRRFFPKADVVDSGARASWDQVRQMITARGYVADFFGKVIPIFIKNSYSNGLTQSEYFYSGYGTRKSLLDTALNVADSGYLTRRLVYSAVNAKLGRVTDCGSTNTIPLTVTSSILKSIAYRYYYLTDPKKDPNAQLLLVKSDDDSLIGKKIYLRSPITCSSPDICRTCYGNLYSIHKSSYIGFIAAQVLGEKSTQLILRTFHTGGIAQGSHDEDTEDIVQAIQKVEEITDRTLDIDSMGDIVDQLMTLYHIYIEYGNVHLVHFETVMTQLLFNLYDGNNYIRFRFDKDDNDNYKFENTKKYSIMVVPEIEGWFLGMIFANAKKNFISGLVGDAKEPNVIESIVMGKLMD